MTHLRSPVRLSPVVAALALTAIVSAQGGGGAQVVIDSVRTAGPQVPGQGGVAMGAVQQNGTGTIVGQIVDADSGKPIPGAIVTIGGAAAPQGAPAQGRIQVLPTGGGGPISIGGPGQNPRVLSDGDGRFAFRSLPKGSYNFTAQKPGFVDGAYGRLRPGGSSQSVDLADGENRGDVKVRLFKFASISGIVVDESGEPIVGAQIRAFRRSLTAGRRMLSAVNATAQTDDRGMYRLGSLIPASTSSRRPTCRRARRRTSSCRVSSIRICFRRCRRRAVASRSARADRPSRRTASSCCKTTTDGRSRPRRRTGG